MRVLGVVLFMLSVVVAQAADEATRASVLERQHVVAYLKRTLLDPYSVRDAEISFVRRSVSPRLCVRLRAKNSFGAYTGLQHMVFYMEPDQSITKVHDEDVFGSCPEMIGWSPLPELTALK